MPDGGNAQYIERVGWKGVAREGPHPCPAGPHPPPLPPGGGRGRRGGPPHPPAPASPQLSGRRGQGSGMEALIIPRPRLPPILREEGENGDGSAYASAWRWAGALPGGRRHVVTGRWRAHAVHPYDALKLDA